MMSYSLKISSAFAEVNISLCFATLTFLFNPFSITSAESTFNIPTVACE